MFGSRIEKKALNKLREKFEQGWAGEYARLESYGNSQAFAHSSSFLLKPQQLLSKNCRISGIVSNGIRAFHRERLQMILKPFPV